MTSPSIGSTPDEFDASASMAIVRAVARRRGVEPIELPPLYDWIDPDALDALFETTRAGGVRNGRLEFTYDGHAVVVDSLGDPAITVDGAPVAGPTRTADGARHRSGA